MRVFLLFSGLVAGMAQISYAYSLGKYSGEHSGGHSDEYSVEHSGGYSGEHSGGHSGEYSGEHSGGYSGEYSGEHSGGHSWEYSGEHSAGHSWEYSGEHSGGHSKEHSGEYPELYPNCPKRCPYKYNPVCTTHDSSGRPTTFANHCFLRKHNCECPHDLYTYEFAGQCERLDK